MGEGFRTKIKGFGYAGLLSFVLCLTAGKILGQNHNDVKPLWKQDTVISDNVFRKHNNWLCGGAGTAINSQIANSQFTGGLDYNFHLRLNYFQFGLFVTGDQFGEYNNYQFHLCYGKRKETSRYNLSCFGGLSYSYFTPKIGPNNYSLNSERKAGLYGCAQVIFKLTYDVGIGPGVFADFNAYQNVEGIRVDLYFSGAYKGKVGAE